MPAASNCTTSVTRSLHTYWLLLMDWSQNQFTCAAPLEMDLMPIVCVCVCVPYCDSFICMCHCHLLAFVAVEGGIQLIFCSKVSIMICGNKIPTRCNRWYLLQILLHAQHVSGHHYAHHQELKSIIQMVAACGIWCFGFQVVGTVWLQPANRTHNPQLHTIPTGFKVVDMLPHNHDGW